MKQCEKRFFDELAILGGERIMRKAGKNRDSIYAGFKDEDEMLVYWRGIVSKQLSAHFTVLGYAPNTFCRIKGNLYDSLYSKDNDKKDFQIGRNYAIIIGLWLELDIDGLHTFLQLADHGILANRPSNKIIKDFVEKRIYDIDEIDKALINEGLSEICKALTRTCK